MEQGQPPSLSPPPSPALSRHLASVLELPTAPFGEARLAEWVLAFAQSRGLPAARDAFGNISVTWDGHGARREGPPLALIAGLDHPGGEVVAVAGDVVEVAWHGELLASHLVQARLRLHGRQGFVAGPVTSCTVRRGHLGEVVDRLLVQVSDRVHVGAIATLDLPGVWLNGPDVQARGAIAVLGAAALLDLLDRLAAARVATTVQAVFTRAATAGFAGACGLVEAGGLLPGQTALCVHGVPEQSGAAVGGGPVLCLGDALALFDPDVARALDHAVSRYRELWPAAPVQRSALAAGASAAGLFALHQRPVGALAVAVGAPMNMGARGRVEPERFSWADYQGLVSLLEMVCVDWDGPEAPARQREAMRQWMRSEAGPALARLAST